LPPFLPGFAVRSRGVSSPFSSFMIFATLRKCAQKYQLLCTFCFLRKFAL
jgi:hypothetical protein